MAERTPLRLLAEDKDDLAVLSAALQDAIARVGDIEYDPRGRRLTIGFNRFRWEGAKRQRVRAGLQVGGVLSLKARRIRRDPDEPPGGVLTLTFAGGGDLRAEVECLDLMLVDVSDPWPTPRAPDHQA
jgi:hypothetical protein